MLNTPGMVGRRETGHHFDRCITEEVGHDYMCTPISPILVILIYLAQKMLITPKSNNSNYRFFSLFFHFNFSMSTRKAAT